MLKYTEDMHCTKKDLERLYLSVNWNSGKYPDKLYESIKNSTYKIFVYDDDKLIGLVSGLSDECINLFISYLVIDPEYQNNGIGTSIIKNILNNNDIVYLWVYKENKIAISLYKRLGFNIIEENESRYYMKYSN